MTHNVMSMLKPRTIKNPNLAKQYPMAKGFYNKQK